MSIFQTTTDVLGHVPIIHEAAQFLEQELPKLIPFPDVVRDDERHVYIPATLLRWTHDGIDGF